MTPNRETDRSEAVAALVDAMYADRCVEPPQTDHAEHVLDFLLGDPRWAARVVAALRPEREEAADWTVLANDIRTVDGNHDLGAGELAARLVERGWRRPEREEAGLRAAQDWLIARGYISTANALGACIDAEAGSAAPSPQAPAGLREALVLATANIPQSVWREMSDDAKATIDAALRGTGAKPERPSLDALTDAIEFRAGLAVPSSQETPISAERGPAMGLDVDPDRRLER